MKAMVCPKYGSPDVLQMQEVEKPTPKDNEVLIKVHAASINAADRYMMRGKPLLIRLAFGLRRPKHPVLGADIAGHVEAVGVDVKQWKSGDAVFGDLSMCGFGGFGEYVCAPENIVTLKPANLTFEAAAAVPMAAVTALQGLRDKGQIQAGQKVVVNGAGGGVGSFAVQIAKALGAEVTGVCSTRKMDMVRSIGADHVIDYTQEDFTQKGQRYDLIFDVGAYRSISEYKRALSDTGVYVLAGGALARIFQAMFASMVGNKRVYNYVAKSSPADLAFISQFLESGKIVPMIDRCYPLHEIAKAMAYFETGQVQGKVVIVLE